MIWFSKESKDPSCHNMFPKYQGFWIILTFDFSRFKFPKGLKFKTFIYGIFSRQTPPLHPNHIKCLDILADYKQCINYKDFGTWLCRWSKWNGDVHFFLHTLSQLWVDTWRALLHHKSQEADTLTKCSPPTCTS